MRNIAIGLAVLAVILSYQLYKIPVPKDAVDKIKLGLILGVIKIFGVKHEIKRYLYGEEHRYLSMVESARFPYLPQPDKIEDGLKIQDTKFGNIRVRIYESLTKKKNGPAIIYYHGGGFAMGTADGIDAELLCKEWATKLNILAVSVEYRLAPENPYPAPLTDCVDATTYFIQHAVEFDVDPRRIAIAGASAGGNLAAAATIKLRDMKINPQPKLLLLISPITQALDFNLPSYLENEHDPLLSKDRMVAMWLMYAKGNISHLEYAINNNSHVSKEVKSKMTSIINHDVITRRTGSTPEPTDGKPEVWDELKDVMLDPYLSPLLADDLSGLPQTLVHTTEQDVLRDDGILFAHRLREAGNRVEHFHNKAAHHATVIFLPNSPDFKESKKKMLSFFRGNL